MGLLAVAALVTVTGFFVAAEFALVAVDRHRVSTRAATGDRRAARLERVLHRLSFHLSGAQLGITVTSLVLGFIAKPAVAAVIEPAIGKAASVALALVGVTVLSMVASELVPKNIAIARPDRVATAVARPIALYGAMFGFVIRSLNAAADAVVRRVGIEPTQELSSVRSLDELGRLIQSSGRGGALDEDAYTLLTKTLRFNEKTAADALVPRTAMTPVAPDDSIPRLIDVSAATGYSRFPVCRDDLDDVVGTVHVKDVYRLPVERRADATVASIMAEPFVVPESRDLGSLLGDLRTGSHLAVVVDEYGGTAGIITLEDVLEEIVGDIDDEHDRPSSSRVTPTGTFELPGSLHPDEVADASGYVVPEGEYETLAGFVLDKLGRIPEVGEGFVESGWLVEVLEVDRHRVATVRLTAPAIGDVS